MFPKDGLEIKLVRNVKNCGNSLGIAVDHNGFITAFLGRQYPVNAGIVKFYSLAYPVWPGSKYEHFFSVGGDGFIFFSEGGIEIRGFGFKFRGTGVHQLKDPLNSHLVSPFFKDLAFEATDQVCDLTVRISLSLCLFHKLLRNGIDFIFRQGIIQIHQLLDLFKKPFVNFGEVLNGTEGYAQFEGIVYMKQSVPARIFQTIQQLCLVLQFFTVSTQAVSADLQGLTCFLKCLLKISTDAHYLTDRFHGKSQPAVRTLELIKVTAGNLHDNII